MEYFDIVVDKLSKQAHFSPTVGTASANDTARIFWRDVCRLHELPWSVISDRDPKFTGEFWRALMEMWDVTLRMSTSAHPQTNGQSERVIQILEHMLHCFVSYHQEKWLKYLPTLEFVYNNSTSIVTSYTPFFMNSGYHPQVLTTSIPRHTNVKAVKDWVVELDAIMALTKDRIIDA